MADAIDYCTMQMQAGTDFTLKSISAMVKNMMDASQGTRHCVDCDCAIDEKRIRAVPGAVRCVRCQTEYEQQK